MRRPRLLAGLALIGTLMLPMQAQSQTSLTPDTWFTFGWDAQGVVSTQFTATTSTILVVDCCIVGDMFEIFADGSSVGTTSAVAADDGTSTGATTGDVAWADSRLSKGMFSVSVGDLITIQRTQQAVDFATGDGFIKAVVTPEPGTVALLMVGLMGLAFVGTRRRELLQS